MVKKATAATVLAFVLFPAAFLALLSSRHVLAGTLLIFTAIAIYVRETNT